MGTWSHNTSARRCLAISGASKDGLVGPRVFKPGIGPQTRCLFATSVNWIHSYPVPPVWRWNISAQSFWHLIHKGCTFLINNTLIIYEIRIRFYSNLWHFNIYTNTRPSVNILVINQCHQVPELPIFCTLSLMAKKGIYQLIRFVWWAG